MWVNSSEMRTDATRRAYLEKVAALGAVGIKIDFIPACTAEITRWYEGALKDTAELHLLCNFHGAVKPTGRRRTWPHELTREAVRGHEYHMTRVSPRSGRRARRDRPLHPFSGRPGRLHAHRL